MATIPSSTLPPPSEVVYRGAWLIITRLPLARGRITHRYEVLTREDSTCLAEIRWYGPWRCYVLVPKDGSIWESRCLADVVEFLGQLKQERKR